MLNNGVASVRLKHDDAGHSEIDLGASGKSLLGRRRRAESAAVHRQVVDDDGGDPHARNPACSRTRTVATGTVNAWANSGPMSTRRSGGGGSPHWTTFLVTELQMSLGWCQLVSSASAWDAHSKGEERFGAALGVFTVQALALGKRRGWGEGGGFPARGAMTLLGGDAVGALLLGTAVLVEPERTDQRLGLRYRWVCASCCLRQDHVCDTVRRRRGKPQRTFRGHA